MNYTYKQFFQPDDSTNANAINRSDGACIPFDPANTDYAEFKKAVTAGAELQDADGNVMSEQAAQDFIRTLP
jgi:hypothetical protein